MRKLGSQDIVVLLASAFVRTDYDGVMVVDLNDVVRGEECHRRAKELVDRSP